MRAFLIVLALFGALFLNGCTMIPAYQRPALPVADSWPDGVHGEGTSSPDNIGWETFFQDETIALLVRTALENNRDLGMALLNIERARAMYQIQRADLLPTVNVSGSSANQSVPPEISATGQRIMSRQQSVSVGFTSFELDLFGRIRSLKESALQQYFATEEAAKSAQLSLVAEVVSAYLRLTADREILELARTSYENRKEVYELISKQFEFGVTSQLDLNQARTTMEEARVMVAQYKTVVAQDENALVLLLGTGIPAEAKMASRLAEVRALPDLDPGMPSELLLRRPDIMGAEYTLLAANANIGAARANFFPRIGITTSLGTISPEWSNLFTAGAETWIFTPSVTLPVFDTGRNIANLRVSETDKEIAILQYEKSIQTAFREVADQLAQKANIGEQLAAQESHMQAAKGTYDLSLARYNAGIDAFISVLDAQRTYTGAQQNMINTRLLRETNMLNLYKALGGGWY